MGKPKERLTIENQKSKAKSHDMYRRPKFLTVLHQIRETMSREADYDVDLFAEMVRSVRDLSMGPNETSADSGSERRATTMKLVLPRRRWLQRRG